MSKSAHTPGPWKVGVHRQSGRAVAIVADTFGGSLCVVPDGLAKPLIPPEESDANIRLMAAAPDLLAALQAVVRVADRKTDEFDAARAAIAKAKGLTTG